MALLPGSVVDSDHPMVKESVAKMVKEGYEKETIMRVVGVPAEVVDSAMIRAAGGAPKPVITDGKHKEMVERMAKMRAARGKNKAGAVAKAPKTE